MQIAQEIAQEIAIVDHLAPRALGRVLRAIQEGKIISEFFVYGQCGCFYGHSAELDAHEAEALQGEVFGHLDFGWYRTLTPIEALLFDFDEEGRLDQAIDQIKAAILEYQAEAK